MALLVILNVQLITIAFREDIEVNGSITGRITRMESINQGRVRSERIV